MKRKSPKMDVAVYGHLIRAIAAESSPETVERLFGELLTPSERCDIALRWKLLRRLVEGHSHRAIAQELGISPCKITRGSRILKDPKSVCRTMLQL